MAPNRTLELWTWLQALRPVQRLALVGGLLVLVHLEAVVAVAVASDGGAGDLVALLTLFGLVPLTVATACVVSVLTKARAPIASLAYGIGLYFGLGLLTLPWLMVPMLPAWPGLLYWQNLCALPLLPCPG